MKREIIYRLNIEYPHLSKKVIETVANAFHFIKFNDIHIKYDVNNKQLVLKNCNSGIEEVNVDSYIKELDFELCRLSVIIMDLKLLGVIE